MLAIVLTDDVRGEWGREFEQQLKLRAPDARVRYVDPESAKFQTDDLVRSAERAQSVVVAVYASPSAGKPLNNPTALLSDILDHAGAKTVVVAMGSPNTAQNLDRLQNYLCTFSSATVSETSAVRALFGEIPIRGRLPVTIPGVAERGAGIDKPAQIMQGRMNRHAPHKKSSIAR